MDAELLEKIKETALPVLTEEAVELVDIRSSRSKGALLIKFLVDKSCGCAQKPGGITVDECACLNRRIARLMEEKDIIQQSYVLEVSSPGLDRPLVTTRDFQRCLGTEVRLVLHTPLNGQNVLSGILDEADEGMVVIHGRENEKTVVELKDIARARREIDNSW